MRSMSDPGASFDQAPASIRLLASTTITTPIQVRNVPGPRSALSPDSRVSTIRQANTPNQTADNPK